MRYVGEVIDTALLLCIIILLARFVLDWVRVFARNWRPSGALAVLCEVLYSLTDPPLNAVKRFMPPMRLGGAAIDFSPMILLIALYLLKAVNYAIFY